MAKQCLHCRRSQLQIIVLDVPKHAWGALKWHPVSCEYFMYGADLPGGCCCTYLPRWADVWGSRCGTTIFRNMPAVSSRGRGSSRKW
eukprot:6180170-Pleurochrysis_carterae.AAC.2